MQVTPDTLDTAARLVWGNHWMERLGRRFRIRPRQFEDMIAGREFIPEAVIEAVAEALRNRRGEIDVALDDLSDLAEASAR